MRANVEIVVTEKKLARLEKELNNRLSQTKHTEGFPYPPKHIHQMYWLANTLFEIGKTSSANNLNSMLKQLNKQKFFKSTIYFSNNNNFETAYIWFLKTKLQYNKDVYNDKVDGTVWGDDMHYDFYVKNHILGTDNASVIKQWLKNKYAKNLDK